ncbi:hypothetical protein F6Y03_30840 [Bacillus megaterium]|jgi:hypothetical protein|nr:hypothetical protein [Priestia megaterium]
MATYDTGKYELEIHDDAVSSLKAQQKSQEHIQKMMLSKDMTISQRIGYMFWLRVYIDAFFENMHEKQLEKEGKANATD